MLAILNPIRTELSRILPRTLRVQAPSVRSLLADLNHRQPEVRKAAVVALGEARETKAIPDLALRLNDPHPSVRHAVVDALGCMNHPDVVPYLAPLLESRNPTNRTSVLMALMWTDAEVATVALVRALMHSDPDIRKLAAATLVNRHPSPVSWLLTSLCSQSDLESEAARQVLVRIGEPAVRPLLALVCGPDAGIRALAASALIEIGQPSLPALYRYCNCDDYPDNVDAMLRHILKAVECNPDTRRSDT